MASFGELLGAEIREARNSKGWTQLALSEVAYGDRQAERRIRDYELGKVKRPQAKVYKHICDALGITARRISELKSIAGDAKAVNLAEVSELRKEKGSLEKALSEVKLLSRGQLETLSSLFGLDKPYVATDVKLFNFLESKARDFAALRAEVEVIDDQVRALSNLKASALDAFEIGDLDTVDILLDRVMEISKEEAAKAAEIKADAALLRGRSNRAYELLVDAADSFAIVDPLEPMRKRFEYHKKIYSHGLNHGRNSLQLSVEIINITGMDRLRSSDPYLLGEVYDSLANALRNLGALVPADEGISVLRSAVDAHYKALEMRPHDTFPREWAATQANLANSLQSLSDRLEGDEAAQLLTQSADACRSALKMLTRDTYPNVWAGIHNVLGIVLGMKGEREVGDKGDLFLEESAASFRAALEVRDRQENEILWAETVRNLANALTRRGVRSAKEAGCFFLFEAVDFYRQSLEVYTLEKYPNYWEMSQNNLANSLQQLGERTEGERGLEILEQAIDTNRALLDVRKQDANPVGWATTQNNLANSLWSQGKRAKGVETMRLFTQAVNAYYSALEERRRETQPLAWANTHENLATVEYEWACHYSCGDNIFHLKSALNHVDKALAVYDSENDSQRWSAAINLKSRIQAKMNLF